MQTDLCLVSCMNALGFYFKFHKDVHLIYLYASLFCCFCHTSILMQPEKVLMGLAHSFPYRQYTCISTVVIQIMLPVHLYTLACKNLLSFEYYINSHISDDSKTSVSQPSTKYSDKSMVLQVIVHFKLITPLSIMQFSVQHSHLTAPKLIISSPELKAHKVELIGWNSSCRPFVRL